MQKDTKRSPVVSFRIGWKTIEELQAKSLIKEKYTTSDLNSVVKQVFYGNLDTSTKAPINADFLQSLEEVNSTNYQLMRLRIFDVLCDLEAEDYLRTVNAIAQLEKNLKQNAEHIKSGNYDKISSQDEKAIVKLKEEIDIKKDSSILKEVSCFLSVTCEEFVDYLNSI